MSSPQTTDGGAALSVHLAQYRGDARRGFDFRYEVDVRRDGCASLPRIISKIDKGMDNVLHRTKDVFCAFSRVAVDVQESSPSN
jgi:hypothetical protein